MIDLSLLDWVLVGEGGIVTAAIAFYLLHGVWLRRRSLEEQTLRTAGRASLARLLAPTGAVSPHDVASLRSLPMRIQIPLFNELSKNVAGAQKSTLRELARSLGLVTQALRECTSRRWPRRLRGARFLAQLGEPDALVLSLLRDRHSAVRAQAAEWAGTDPTPEVVTAMLELLADPATLSRFAVQDALLRMGEAMMVPLAEYLVVREGPAALAGLRVAAATGDGRFHAIALHYSHDTAPDGDAAASSAELLAAIGGAEAASRLLAMTAFDSERAQIAAIRALGRMRHWPAASRLAAMLEHPRWKVRHASALALRTIGAPGLLLLRRARAGESIAAAEIARLVLDLPDAVR